MLCCFHTCRRHGPCLGATSPSTQIVINADISWLFSSISLGSYPDFNNMWFVSVVSGSCGKEESIAAVINATPPCVCACVCATSFRCQSQGTSLQLTAMFIILSPHIMSTLKFALWRFLQHAVRKKWVKPKTQKQLNSYFVGPPMQFSGKVSDLVPLASHAVAVSRSCHAAASSINARTIAASKATELHLSLLRVLLWHALILYHWRDHVFCCLLGGQVLLHSLSQHSSLYG